MIDIGGGSTEIAIGRGLDIQGAVSLQLGASRLFAAHPVNSLRDAESALAAAEEACLLIPQMLVLHSGVELFYSVGGTGTACACLMQGMNRKAANIEGYILRRDDVYAQLLRVAAVPRKLRARIPGFPSSRVDIMPTGLAIMTAVMDRLGIDSVTVTERTNGDGLLRASVRQNNP